MSKPGDCKPPVGTQNFSDAEKYLYVKNRLYLHTPGMTREEARVKNYLYEIGCLYLHTPGMTREEVCGLNYLIVKHCLYLYTPGMTWKEAIEAYDQARITPGTPAYIDCVKGYLDAMGYSDDYIDGMTMEQGRWKTQFSYVRKKRGSTLK